MMVRRMQDNTDFTHIKITLQNPFSCVVQGDVEGIPPVQLELQTEITTAAENLFYIYDRVRVG